MKFKFKNWWEKSLDGNTYIPLLAFGFNKESFFIIILGFSLSIWID